MQSARLGTATCSSIAFSGRSGIAFDVINGAEESRLVFLAVRICSDGTWRSEGAWALLAEVGGGSTSLTLLRGGQPNRSGVYALGAVRLRQQLELWRHSHELQVALLNVTSPTWSRKFAWRSRSAGSPISSPSAVTFGLPHRRSWRERPRRGFARSRATRFLAFCDEVERLDEERLIDRFRLPAVEAETLAPALLVYRALLSETASPPGAHLRRVAPGRRAAGFAEPSGPSAPRTSNARCWPAPRPLGSDIAWIAHHGQHVANLCARLFDALSEEHGLGERERLLLRSPACCTTWACT